MKSEKFNPLEMYGDRGVFERKLEEGYNEVAFGGGAWICGERIAALWAFYKPKRWFRRERVSTLQYYEFITPDEDNMRSDPFEKTYSLKKFMKYISTVKIKMDEKRSLSEILETWDNNSPKRLIY